MSTTSVNLSLTLAEGTDVVDVDQHIAANFATLDSKWSTPGTPADVVVGSSGTPGSSTVVSRSDHVHRVTTATPSSVGTTNSAGSNTTVAASDHIHKLGDLSVPSAAIQADAVTEAKLDILDSPADNDVLTYDSSTGRMEWQAAAAISGAVARAGDTMTGQLVLANGSSNGVAIKNSSGVSKLLSAIDGADNFYLGHADAAATFLFCNGASLNIHDGSGFYVAYHTGNIATAPGMVPSGAVVWFETLAELTAAGASWERYTEADGRLLVGAGSTFSQTFAQAFDYGSNWTPSSGLTAASSGVAVSATAGILGSLNAGANSVTLTNHTHPAPTIALSGTSAAWLPPMRGGIWGRKL